MSWDELRTRLRQAFGKRAEYALARIHLLAGQDEVRWDAASSASFFFAPDQLAERIQLLKEHVPSAVAETIEEADEIMQHRFRLLGYRDITYGTEIDWHRDAVHEKRAPLKPWYKIHFLDFDEVGDHKITWELNRHQHWVTLAKAYVCTGNDKYVDEIVRQFYSWQRANPYPMGINWGSSLEVAFRSLSWLWTCNLLRGITGLTAEFEHDLVTGLGRNGHYIERYLSTYFSPNTHLIGEAVALFFIGTLCPQLSRSREWQKKGWAIVLAEAERQVRPDGVYFEQSLYYHVYALDFFLHTRALASCNTVPIPEAFDNTLLKMLEVVRVLSQLGSPQSFGDDDGGRVFNPRRNRAEHLSDPLAIGGAIFGQFAHGERGPVTEESIWLFGSAPLQLRLASSREPLAPVAFEDGGLHVLASSECGNAQLLIDAGPHGIGHGGHGHADALSITLSINDRPWLIDSGSFVYIGSGGERDQFRGTVAHNTLRVDRLDQAIPEGPFRWSALPQVRAEQWLAGKSFTFFSGIHDGYKRLPDPILHRRTVFHLHGQYWLVQDFVEGAAEHEVELFWHFAPDLNVEADPRALVASSKNEKVVLLSASKASWKIAVEQGLVSPAYGVKQSAPVGVFRTRSRLPCEHATLVVPMQLNQRHGRFRLDLSSQPTTSYVYENGGVTDYLVLANGMNWSIGPICSDAKLLFLRMQEQEIVSLILCYGSAVELEGRKLVAFHSPVERFEWRREAGLFTSDERSLEFLDQELLRARIPVR